MPIGQSSSVRLKSIDYVYVPVSCIAGVWQAWCFNYGANSILVYILLSLPFALMSYAHASLVRTTRDVAGHPSWKRTLVLWGGMPVSLVVGVLTMGAETGIMYAAGIDNLHFITVRFFIGEGAACLMWATCLLVWSRQPGLRLSRSLLLAVFAVLFASVLFAYGLSYLIFRSFHKDIYALLISVFATTMSALILVFLSRNAQEDGRRDIAPV
jgi:hypothetical protein